MFFSFVKKNYKILILIICQLIGLTLFSWHHGSSLQDKITLLTEKIERVHEEHHNLRGVLGQVPILNLFVEDVPTLDLGKEKFTSNSIIYTLPGNYLKVQHLLYLREQVKDELLPGDLRMEILSSLGEIFLQVVVLVSFVGCVLILMVRL